MLFRVVGGTYDDDASTGSGTAAGARPPHPVNVNITPSQADVNSILIANVSAPGYEDSRDDDGHIFSFQYQWYVNGVAAAGETLPYFPAAGTAMAADNRISVAVFSMDIYGATSTTVMSNALAIQASIADGGTTAGATMAYENNSTKSMANRILPKTVESSMSDGNIQRHFFHEAGDVDWMWFLVPETMSNSKKRVLFETNTNSEMYNRYHQAEQDFGVDTQLVLYNQQGVQLHRNDDFGNPIGIGGTRYARFDRLLDPGIYFVQISLANTKEYGSSVTAATPYYVHLFMEEGSTSLGPTPATTVTLSPASAAGTDNLVCTVAGSQSTSTTGVTYLYVWYRDGFVVPFGKTNATLETWNTQRYLVYNAKNYSADANLSAAPHIVPAEFTGAGPTWYCDVYAMDEYGISDPVRSNEAVVASSEWQQAFRVDRSYLRNVGTPVTQLVTLGWADNATFGFDAAYDSAIPSMMVPGTDTPINEPVSMGRFYSVGMHDSNIMLDRDIRPFGRGGSWFLKIEMGDSSIDQCTLSWDAPSMPNVSVGALTLTRMRQTTNGTFVRQPGASVNMMERSSLVFTAADIATMQIDEYGQKYAVFSVSLGAPDAEHTVSLKAGWNMISVSVTPLYNSIDQVFASGDEKYYRGTVWVYENGQYVPATTVVAGRGYWLYAPKAVSFKIYGDMDVSGMSLKKGWNIVGPVADIVDFKTSYADFVNVVLPGNIYRFVVDAYGNPGYESIEIGGKYPLKVGEAYWIKAEADIDLPFVP